MKNTYERSKLGKITSVNNFSLIVVLVLLVVILSIFNKNFFTSKNLLTIMLSASVVGLLAIGETYLIIGGAIDVSCGAVAAMSGVLVATMISSWGIPPLPAVILVLIVGMFVGIINAILVTKFSLQPFIATLATSSMCEGIGFLICKGRSVSISKSNTSALFIGTGKIFGIQLPIIFLILLFIIFGVILAKTKFGRHIYMVGGNKIAARLAGIRTECIMIQLYMLSGAIASFAGVILAARLSTGAPSAILGSEFDAITAVVLGGVAFNGGKGTLAGCFIGLMIIQCFSNGLTIIGVSSFWQTVAKGFLLVAALILDDFRNKRNILK